MKHSPNNNLAIDKNYIKKLFTEFDNTMKVKFEKKCLDCESAPTEVWTGTVLGTFRQIGKQRKFTCDSSFTNGEYLFDLCWTTYPSYPYRKCEYYTQYYKYFNDNLKFGSPQIVLALESEWGVEKDKDRSRTLVLDDFCKIRDAKSIIKVMIFGFHREDISSFDKIVTFMKELMKHPYYQEVHEYYLLYGISWHPDDKEWEKLRKVKAYTVLGNEVIPIEGLL
jgi:hypothetical protein